MDSAKLKVEFSKWKAQTLCKMDLSKKGSIDVLIEDLVCFLNNQYQYCTTSSCSGRISVLSDDLSRNELPRKSKKCYWHLVSHENVLLSDVLQVLQSVTGQSKLKFEGFVMHVRCQSLDDAISLLNVAILSGYRNSGISIGKHGRNVMVAVRGTQCLEIPLSDSQGQVLVPDSYIKHIIEIANDKMKQNITRLQKFKVNVKDMLLAQKLKRVTEEPSLHLKQISRNSNNIQLNKKVELGNDSNEDDNIIDNLQFLYESSSAITTDE